MFSEQKLISIYNDARKLAESGVAPRNPYLKMTGEHIAFSIGCADEYAMSANDFISEMVAYKKPDGSAITLLSNLEGEFRVAAPSTVPLERQQSTSLSSACEVLSNTVLRTLYQQWHDLGDIPTFSSDTNEFEEDSIKAAFLDFPIGTAREDVWHWFEEQHPEFVVGEVLNGQLKFEDEPEREGMSM